jgi:hypothetical protein
MSRILMVAIGFAFTTAVSAAQFSVELWGVTYVAAKDDVAESVFRLDDNECRRGVTHDVSDDAANGVNAKAVWTKVYLKCMESKSYEMTIAKPN